MLELQDRLSEINRSFTAPAIVTDFPEIWREFDPDAVIAPAAPVLALQPQAHDLVIHAMAMHWADDPVGQMVQARHALRPDGLLMVVHPGGDTLTELRAALAQAEAEITGGLSPRVLPMGELRDLGGLLSRAGLALPVADRLRQNVSYRDLCHLARDLRAMGETNAMTARLRQPTRRAVMELAAALYAASFPDEDNPGRVRATFELVFLTGWAPDPGQQQPLRPGSATHALAEILNTERETGK